MFLEFFPTSKTIFQPLFQAQNISSTFISFQFNFPLSLLRTLTSETEFFNFHFYKCFFKVHAFYPCSRPHGPSLPPKGRRLGRYGNNQVRWTRYTLPQPSPGPTENNSGKKLLHTGNNQRRRATTCNPLIYVRAASTGDN